MNLFLKIHTIFEIFKGVRKNILNSFIREIIFFVFRSWTIEKLKLTKEAYHGLFIYYTIIAVIKNLLCVYNANITFQVSMPVFVI